MNSLLTGARMEQRSVINICESDGIGIHKCGGIGIHEGLKILRHSWIEGRGENNPLFFAVFIFYL